MFRNAPALCGRLFAVSAAAAGRQGCAQAGAAAAAANNNNSNNTSGALLALRASAASPLPSVRPAVCGFSAAAGPTVFDKLGGKAAMKLAVDKFYEKVLADPTVNGFFSNVSMTNQKKKQLSFMSYAFGGPEGYKGKDMFEAHKNMDLKEEHFNAIAKHFIDTLKELNVKQQYIDEAVAVVLTTKDAILKTGAYAGKA